MSGRYLSASGADGWIYAAHGAQIFGAGRDLVIKSTHTCEAPIRALTATSRGVLVLLANRNLLRGDLGLQRWEHLMTGMSVCMTVHKAGEKELVLGGALEGGLNALHLGIDWSPVSVDCGTTSPLIRAIAAKGSLLFCLTHDGTLWKISLHISGEKTLQARFAKVSCLESPAIDCDGHIVCGPEGAYAAITSDQCDERGWTRARIRLFDSADCCLSEHQYSIAAPTACFYLEEKLICAVPEAWVEVATGTIIHRPTGYPLVAAVPTLPGAGIDSAGHLRMF